MSPRHIIDFFSVINGKEVLSRKCRSCNQVKNVEDFKTNTIPGKNVKTGTCRACRREQNKRQYLTNKKKGKPSGKKIYHDMLVALPKIWGSRQYIDLVKEFNFKCAMSGIKSIDEDVGIDHFVAISTGHGGTVKENLLPVNRSINSSKGGKNPFEWIKERPDLDKRLFDESVAHLAKLNNLSVSEYKQFVYWCYNNPRTTEEVLSDNDLFGFKKPSVDIWRDTIRNNKEVG